MWTCQMGRWTAWLTRRFLTFQPSEWRHSGLGGDQTPEAERVNTKKHSADRGVSIRSHADAHHEVPGPLRCSGQHRPPGWRVRLIWLRVRSVEKSPVHHAVLCCQKMHTSKKSWVAQLRHMTSWREWQGLGHMVQSADTELITQHQYNPSETSVTDSSSFCSWVTLPDKPCHRWPLTFRTGNIASFNLTALWNEN